MTLYRLAVSPGARLALNVGGRRLKRKVLFPLAVDGAVARAGRWTWRWGEAQVSTTDLSKVEVMREQTEDEVERAQARHLKALADL